MTKKILFLILLTFTLSIINTRASSVDSLNTEGITAFEWTPILDSNKIMQYENQKNLTPQRKKQAKLAVKNYTNAVSFMKNKEYDSAIKEFKAAMKRYKRAKLSVDAMNIIYINMALSYAKTGNREDKAQAEKWLGRLTSKAYNDKNWAYNIAIAQYLTGKPAEAASVLSSIIRKDNFYFQAYVTLEAIYRKSDNINDAEKVKQRMHNAKEKLNKKNRRVNDQVTKKKIDKRQKVKALKAKKPDITNLKIVTTDNHKQYNNIKKISEKNISLIEQGISDYNNGVKELSERNPKTAQKPLKDAEKKIKAR
jgi:tetratricopeptide (TPR) repeat protein